MPGQVYARHIADLPRETRFDAVYERVGVVMDAANVSFVWLQPEAFDVMGGEDQHAPGHSHPFDQLMYIIEGHLEFWTGDTVHELGPGDVMYIPRDVAHGGKPKGREPVHLVEIFAPIRTDYLYTADDQLGLGQAPRRADGSRVDERPIMESAAAMGDSTPASPPNRELSRHG